jgi:hypothetical protein
MQGIRGGELTEQKRTILVHRKTQAIGIRLQVPSVKYLSNFSLASSMLPDQMAQCNLGQRMFTFFEAWHMACSKVANQNLLSLLMLKAT